MNFTVPGTKLYVVYGMKASEKFDLIKRACNERRVCQLNFRDEKIPLFIHPLGVCLTPGRGLVIVCCVENSMQLNDKGDPLVSNLAIEDCHHLQLMPRKFEIVPGRFKESEICDDWLFHVTATGT